MLTKLTEVIIANNPVLADTWVEKIPVVSYRLEILVRTHVLGADVRAVWVVFDVDQHDCPFMLDSGSRVINPELFPVSVRWAGAAAMATCLLALFEIVRSSWHFTSSCRRRLEKCLKCWSRHVGN